MKNGSVDVLRVNFSLIWQVSWSIIVKWNLFKKLRHFLKSVFTAPCTRQMWFFNLGGGSNLSSQQISRKWIEFIWKLFNPQCFNTLILSTRIRLSSFLIHFLSKKYADWKVLNKSAVYATFLLYPGDLKTQTKTCLCKPGEVFKHEHELCTFGPVEEITKNKHV